MIKYYKEQIEEPTVEACYIQWSTYKLKHNEIEKQTYDRYTYRS